MGEVVILNKCALDRCSNTKSKEFKEVKLCTPCTLNSVRRMAMYTIPHPLTNELIEAVLTSEEVSNEVARRIHGTYQFLVIHQDGLIKQENDNVKQHGYDEKDYV